MSKERKAQFLKLKMKSEKKVRNWILEHSLFPESYKSDTFFNFIVTYSNESTNEPISFLIKHKFTLRNKDSVLKNTSWYFELNDKFFITAASEDSSKNNIREYAYKGELYWDSWFENMGGDYTDKDSVAFATDKDLQSLIFLKKMHQIEDMHKK